MKKLERSLELPAVVAIALSAMLGSGIFVLPGLAAAKTGPSVWLAYVFSGICVLPAALAKAELATAMPTSGGTYVYLERTFGPLAGTISGLGLWASLLLKSSFALVGFSAYLTVLADLPLKPTALVLLCAMVLLNIRGVGKVGGTQLVIIAISVGALALLGIGSFATTFDSARFVAPFRHGSTGFLAAAGFVFVSYAGVTKVAAIAEEIRNPARNLPASIITSLGIAVVLYGTITAAMIGAIPLEELAVDVRPVYTLALRTGGWFVGLIFAFVGVLTLTSMANAGLLAASRFPFAMSRDRLVPQLFGSLHARYLTPTASIIGSGAVMAAAILLLDIERIVKAASALMVMMFILANIAVVVLRETRVQWYKPAYRMPWYPWMPLFGVVSGLVFLAMIGFMALAAAVATILPGAILWAIHGRRQTARLGVLGIRGRRQDLIRATPELGALASAELTGKADVVVALFGHERSPETLVELAAGLADGGHVQVVHLTEVPEQTDLDALDHEEPHVASVRRRVGAMAELEHVNLEFEAIVVHDVIRSVHQITTRLDCQWLVIGWGGRSRGTFTLSNPLGGLREHLTCNLAVFRDVGVRYFRRMLVHAEPGPHDALVVRTANELARVYDSQLTLARFVADTSLSSQAAADYLDQLRRLAGSDTETLLVRGRREAIALGEISAGYDLIVTGDTGGGGLLKRLAGTSSDLLTETAACSVLQLQTPRGKTHQVLERSLPASGTRRQDRLDLTEYLRGACTGTRLQLRRKDPLFAHVAACFAGAVPGLQSDAVLEALLQREKMQNTAVGHGIALPHATIAEANETHLGVFTTAAPIDYGAPDGEGVDVFFATVGPPGDRHIHLLLLAAISRLALNTQVLDRLRGATRRDELLAAIRTSVAELDG